MKKDKEWLRDEVSELYPSYNEMYMSPDYETVAKTETISKVLELIDQLDAPEVLSEKWIESNTSPVDDEGRLYIWKRDLQNLLVPKQDLPVIPKFVAEWIEEAKDRKLTLYGAINECPREVDYWLVDGDSSNQETFARAWLDGYEVEKEKKYRVVFPYKWETVYLREGAHGDFDVIETETYGTQYTEAEIKAIDERYWVFAQEVTE